MQPFFKVLIPLMLLILNLVGPPAAQAAVVGHFTEVVGRVDLMRGGQLPTIEVKLQDPVETGDIVRSKTEFKVQITFIDAATINIAPDTAPVIPPPPPPPPPAPPPRP
jgi:hypothetical protein